MIPNHWYAVIEANRVGTQKPVGIVRMGEALVLWRDASGVVRCLRDRCPHRGAALSAGNVVDGCVACPFHGFRFDAEGRCVLMPCEGRAARIPAGLDAGVFRVAEGHGFIWLWWGDDRAELPPIPWLDGFADDPACSATISEEWEGHWARVMETNIDPHHFPFLHRVLAPWLGPRLDSYTADLDGNTLRTSGVFRHEDRSWGATPFRVDMVFPNLMFDTWTAKIRLFAVSTPIDERHTWVATRGYIDYVPVAVVQRFLSWAFVHVVRLVVQPADKAVIRTLQPRLTGVGVSKLIASDRAVAVFLAHRERLIREAARSAPRAYGVLGIRTSDVATTATAPRGSEQP